MSTSNVLSVVALVVAVIAAIFTGLQWHEAHGQLLLSMKPSVNFMNEDDIDEGAVGVSIDNAGPGPAKIKSVTYFIDRKNVGDVNKVVDFADLEDVHTLDFNQTENKRRKN